jgi:hypothetical protein
MPPQTPTLTLNNGVEMPVLGFRVHQIPADQAVMREHGVQIESWGGFAEVKSSSATSRRGPTPDAAAAAQHRRLHRCRHLVRTRPGPVGPIGKRLQPADL